MKDYILSYADCVIQLIQLDWFSYAFIAMIGLAAVFIIRSVIWGH